MVQNYSLSSLFCELESVKLLVTIKFLNPISWTEDLCLNSEKCIIWYTDFVSFSRVGPEEVNRQPESQNDIVSLTWATILNIFSIYIDICNSWFLSFPSWTHTICTPPSPRSLLHQPWWVWSTTQCSYTETQNVLYWKRKQTAWRTVRNVNLVFEVDWYNL